MAREYNLVYNLIQYCINDNPYIIQDNSEINKLLRNCNINIKYIHRVDPLNYDSNDTILCISYNNKLFGELSLSELYDFLIDFQIVYDTNDKQTNVFTKIDRILQQIEKKINSDSNLIDKYNKINDEYNTMKNNIKSLHTKNRELIHQNETINKQYNDMSNKYNKLLIEYNDISKKYNEYLNSGSNLFS